MNDTIWADAVEKMEPFIFKVSTPSLVGTGFQLSFSKKTGLCGLATAFHIIAHAFEWDEPIKLQHYISNTTILLKFNERAITIFPERDLAFIIFNKQALPLNADNIPLIEKETVLRQGIKTGWCGFPAIAPEDLCFFTGHISTYYDLLSSYLIDGVAINGVSGGPAFYIEEDEEVVLCGIVSAYIPNRATGESLPGVCLVREISPYRNRIAKFKSLSEAVKKKLLIEEPEEDGSDKKLNKQS